MNRSRILTLVKLIVAAGLIAYVVHKAGWEQIKDTLTHIDRRLWFYGLLLMILPNIVALLRWHLLMRTVGLNSTPWLAIRLGFIGIFFNNVLPGLTGGDVVKALYVTRENPQQRASAVVSVIVDRIIGIVALALIAAVIIPFDIGNYGEAAIGIYGFLLAAGIGSVLALSRRAKAMLRSLLGRFGRGSSSEGERKSLLTKMDQAISMYRNHVPTILVALAMSVVVHMSIIMSLWFFGHALADGGLSSLPPDAVAQRDQLEALKGLGVDTYCSIVPIIMIISALPVAPAGWGVGETAFAYFFVRVGVAEADAVALSFTFRITATLISLLGGVFLLLDRKRVLEAAREEAALDGPPPPEPQEG